MIHKCLITDVSLLVDTLSSLQSTRQTGALLSSIETDAAAQLFCPSIDRNLVRASLRKALLVGNKWFVVRYAISTNQL